MKRSPSESAQDALTPLPAASPKKAKKDTTDSPKKQSQANGSIWDSSKFAMLSEEMIAVAVQHMERDKIAEKVRMVPHSK